VTLGIISGSLSISRYRILGDLGLSLKKLNEHLQNFVGGDLLEESLRKEHKASWVMPSGTIAATEDRDGDYWDLADCELEENYLLKMRIEKRKVPGELLNHVAKKEITKLSDQRGKRLSRPEQKELKEMLKEELTTKALPQVSYIDVVWKHSENEVWLLSTAKNTRVLFEELFSKTFFKNAEANLIAIEPPLLGLSDDEWNGREVDTLDDLYGVVPSAVESSNHGAQAAN
jgi:hypothetical protein